MQVNCQSCGYPQQQGMMNCPQCGTQFPMTNQQMPQQPMMNQQMGMQQQNAFGQMPQQQVQGVQWGFVVLGFLIPIVGVILYFVWNKERPETAKACGIAGLIGWVLGFLFIMNM